MGMKLIYGLVLLLIIAIIAVVVFILSKWTKSKTGIYVSVILFLIVILSLMTNYIDQWTFSKKDVISDLKIVNIELRNDFKITDNDVSGMPERIQRTSIEISPADKAEIINQIMTAKNFKVYLTSQDIADDTISTASKLSNEIYNFQYPEFYSTKIYRKIDNYPTRLIVTIDKKENILEYQRIED